MVQVDLFEPLSFYTTNSINKGEATLSRRHLGVDAQVISLMVFLIFSGSCFFVSSDLFIISFSSVAPQQRMNPHLTRSSWAKAVYDEDEKNPG